MKLSLLALMVRLELCNLWIERQLRPVGQWIERAFLKVANSLRLIVSLHVASIIIASCSYHFFEEKSLWDSVWWTFVTAHTVGYGDYTALTVPGRIMAMFFMLYWHFLLLPLLIGNFLMRVIQDKEKFTHSEQEWFEDSLKKIASANNVELLQSPSDY